MKGLAVAHALHLEVSPTLTSPDLHAIALLAERVTEVQGARPLSEQIERQLLKTEPGNFLHICAWNGAELVGYAGVDNSDPAAESSVEIAVDATGRELGADRLLLDQAAHEAGGSVLLWAHGQESAAATLAQSLRFEKVRGLLRMKRQLGADLPKPTLPAGIKIRPFEGSLDTQDWLAVNARAFVDLPDQGRITEADLVDRLAQDWVDLDGFLVAREVLPDGNEGALVGFHWTKVHRAPAGARPGEMPVGEVYVLGVDPSSHGAGLGKALTLAGLWYLKRQGLREVILYVEDNNTAAIATYERLGFRWYNTDVLYRVAR